MKNPDPRIVRVYVGDNDDINRGCLFLLIGAGVLYLMMIVATVVKTLHKWFS